MNHRIEQIARVYAFASRLADRLHACGPTAARLVVGWLFLLSGWGKLHDLASVTDYFTQLGLPAPSFQAVLASSTEFGCGALLLLGLATRAAAIPLMITMTVAIRTALWDQVDSAISLFGLAEFLYIVLLGWLATTGAGPLSLDALIGRLYSRRQSPRSAAARADVPTAAYRRAMADSRS